MENNFINIYRYYDGNKDYFIYSVKNINKLLGYSYFILINVNGKPVITKLDNAIAFLQSNGMKIKAIKQDDPDYEEFINLFSLFIKGDIEPKDSQWKLKLKTQQKLPKKTLHLQKKKN